MNEARRDRLIERAVEALETIARNTAPGKERGPVALAATAHVTPTAAETLAPLAGHVARLADGLDRINAINAELAATRRESLEYRRREHAAVMEELDRGAQTDRS